MADAVVVKDLHKRYDAVVRGLIGNPSLLFLDEPATGFDPNARRNAWQLIRDLRDAGTTVLLTTHCMEEAQGPADRVAVIADGRIVAEGTPETLGGRDTAWPRIRFALPLGAPRPCRHGPGRRGSRPPTRARQSGDCR